MWGIPGAILSMPMLAVAKIICDRVRPLAALGHFLEGSTSLSGSSLICVIRLVRWRTERRERADVTPTVLMDGTHQ
jgi:hypothetical protein